MAALEGVEYPVSGLTKKPKANMNNYFDIPAEEVSANLVHFNALTFKKINRI